MVAIFQGLNAGFTEFNLNFSGVKSVFPNAANPIAGIIHYHKNNGIVFNRVDSNGIVEKCSLMDPQKPPIHLDLDSISPLNRIWYFENSTEVFNLVDAYILELSKLDQFEEGVLNSLSWCLSEITDNITIHSGVGHGFIMGQIHGKNKHVAFSAYDYGMGLFNSLKDSKHKPKETKDSILLAISEGVTRDPKIGAGNGLFGMHEIVRLNNGRISISTGNLLYHFENDTVKFTEKQSFFNKDSQSLAIDFQLNYDQKVSLSDVFKFNGQAYKFINLRIENLENERGEVEYHLDKVKTGFGSRKSGAAIRNDVMNIIRESNQVVVLDFSNISIISSSFADELIGRLMVELGIFKFNNVIRLKGLNNLIQGIVQRSVSQRLSASINQNEE